MPTVDSVDVDRFMGDWYVIAHIPTWIERKAWSAVESYERRPDGSIQTTFTFSKGSFDGPLKRYRPVGFVHNEETGADWRMQFIWPFKSEYLIIHLADDYSTTVVARTRRDYAWIMARSPSLTGETYEPLAALLNDRGYDISKLRHVPHRGGFDPTR